MLLPAACPPAPKARWISRSNRSCTPTLPTPILCRALSGKKPKHTIFVDSKEECDEFDAAEYFNTLPEYVGRTFNRGSLGNRNQGKKTRFVGSSDDDDDEEDEEDILDRLEAAVTIVAADLDADADADADTGLIGTPRPGE